MNSIQLRLYQKEAVEFAYSQKCSVCCLPTGTGKTYIGAKWAHLLFDLKE
ncbi:MAG: DEAD/DEAH box helicase family protein [Candidatus Helarchaeota archaeon]